MLWTQKYCWVGGHKNTVNFRYVSLVRLERLIVEAYHISIAGPNTGQRYSKRDQEQTSDFVTICPEIKRI